MDEECTAKWNSKDKEHIVSEQNFSVDEKCATTEEPFITEAFVNLSIEQNIDKEYTMKRKSKEEEHIVSTSEQTFIVDIRPETKEEESFETAGATEKTEKYRTEIEGSALADTIDTILLTGLPLELIVHIFDYLPNRDKCNASVTCHRLHKAFNHPRLWRKQELLLVSDFSALPSKPDIFCMLEKSKHFIAKFGKYFQCLKIKVIGKLKDLKEWAPVLLELSKQCSLEKLVLDVDSSAFDLRWKPLPKQLLVALLSFIVNADRIKTLDVKSWPICLQTMLNEDQNIFQALIRNKSFKGLEHLDLFWPSKSQICFEEIMPVLLDTSVVLELVQHLTSLQKLGAGSMLLSNNVIEELSNSQRSNKLSLLKIFVIYSAHRKEFPIISSSSWRKLSDSNPDVNVECHIMSRVPHTKLFNMLTIDCPLSKIVFGNEAYLDSKTIETISRKYNKTLKTFESCCVVKDVTKVDDALMKMVEECKCLENVEVKTPGSYSDNYTIVFSLASFRDTSFQHFFQRQT